MPGLAVATTNDTIAGPHGPIPVRRYSPAQPASAVPVVWLHGGAFVKGGLDLPETHDVARALADAGFAVITVDYRLTTLLSRRLSSPGRSRVHYPVPVDDVVAVLKRIQEESPAGVIVGGASAGACLAAAATLRLAAEGAPAPRGVFLAYGIFHATLPVRAPELLSRLRGRRRFTHIPPLLNLVNLYYAGSRAALAEPHAFPGGHQLTGFPPTVLLDADHDSMRASGGRFAAELAAAGVGVEYHVIPGTDHAFLNRPNSPGFAAGLRLIVEWAGRL
ncbi:MAG: alpha/beta hydrolase [Cryobacterium sp.]